MEVNISYLKVQIQLKLIPIAHALIMHNFIQKNQFHIASFA